MSQQDLWIEKNNNPQLSIVIVSWNVRRLLSRCLGSLQRDLLATPDLTAETFVVDNASTDGSQEMVRSEHPWAQLIENSENVGFARANNQAIQTSCGKYVLLLNPDTEVRAGAIASLLGIMDALPGAGAAGARLLNSDGSLQVSCYLEPTLLREFLLMFHLDVLIPYGSYRMDSWPLDRPREVDTLLGACMLLRRSVLKSIGMLDQQYFMYSEEVDLCYRIRRAGWGIYWEPQAEVVHFGGQSTRQAATKMFLQLYRGKVRYFRKNHGSLAATIYRLILVFASLARLALSPVALLEPAERRRQHLGLAGNYLRLLSSLLVE